VTGSAHDPGRRVVDVSLAIATLERPTSLSECLDAVLGGTAVPSEVIVVDQGQEERAEDVVARRAWGPTRPVYVRQRRRGLSASRNAAIAEATRPVVAFTDDDCLPDHGWLEAIERAFTSSGYPDAVTGRVLPLGPPTPGTYAISSRLSQARVDFVGRCVPWLVGTGGNFAVRREWFRRIGTFDERLGAGTPGRAAEDADILNRLLVAGATVRYEPDAVIYHRRQERARRLATRWAYGHGIGALCGLRVRRHDPYALGDLGSWVFNLAREGGRGLARRDWDTVYQRGLSLAGTMRGLVYGLTALPRQ
jgi:O-antigen biosynthesis protein